ncbi:acetyl-CoA C-acetyltransferase [Kineococcus sp. SYSU DK001]|uniref:acetyl-CoA C-acetyltransferase n=1 Tax=Kineococcus sp. SYSU DK001 TaxID=3383122 RepID=UPI003D7E30F7
MPEAVIVATARSPIGRARKGSLRDVRPDDLAAAMVTASLAKVPALQASDIDDLMLGIGYPAGEGGNNAARSVSLLAGLRDVPGVTVNRFCSSSLQTTRMAFHAIRAGEGDAYLSVGVESVSSYDRGYGDGPETYNPRYAGALERTRRTAEGSQEWSDPEDRGELPDVYIDMGQTAENVAALRGVSREEQDEFAVRSQNRAEAAIASGFWAGDITPLTLPDGTVVDADDSPRRGTTLEAVRALNPVFREKGTVTAGNACPLNDGAASVVVVSDRKAAELGLTPLARIVSTGVSGLSPELMGLGPVEASRRALANAGLTIGDIDLVEINEAFAAQVLPSARELGVDEDRLNVFGGAIAVGHPFGMTGARITSTLLNGLRARDGRFGLETMCVGGGQGMAMIVERLS